MVIHFSFLAVILIASVLSEQRIKNCALRSVYEGKNFITHRWHWAIVFGYIAFLAAMRTSSNDTYAYITSFGNLKGTWQAFWDQVASAGEGKDWAFDAVSILFKILVSDDYHLWFALYAVVESAAFIYILRRSSVSLLDSCFFFFCSTLYYNYFSMMRQWFAIVILFAASRLIAEKKFFRYLIICLVVAQFHNSAYLMIPVYFLVQGKAWSKKQFAFIIIAMLSMIYFDSILETLDSSLSGTTYDYAIAAMNSGSGSSIIRAYIAAVPVFLAFLYRDEIKSPMINICVNMSFFNLLLNILAAFTSGLYIIRFATYLNVYNMILYPYLLNVCIRGRNRMIIKPLFYAIYLVFYVYQMNYQGAFSYGSDILGYFK